MARPAVAAGTGKNGSFSVPWARLPLEQHGSFHCLPNPANPPHNTLKVASGLRAARHGEAVGGGMLGAVPRDPFPPRRGMARGMRDGAGVSPMPLGALIAQGWACLPVGCAWSVPLGWLDSPAFAPAGAPCCGWGGLLQRGVPLGMAFPRGSRHDLAVDLSQGF